MTLKVMSLTNHATIRTQIACPHFLRAQAVLPKRLSLLLSGGSPVIELVPPKISAKREFRGQGRRLS